MRRGLQVSAWISSHHKILHDFNAALNIRDEGIRVFLAAGLRRGETLVEAA
jgi:hypothetical protein